MLIQVVLPLSLAFIMFSLGLGLTIEDFTRVAKAPKAFFAGATAQIFLLPAVAFGLLQLFPLPPELATGVMILSFCPGGVTSNILTKFAGGALALSISMTAVVSLLSVVTVPLLVTWSSTHFMGTAAPDISVGKLAISMFAITAVPVAIGLFVRRAAPEKAIKAEPWVARIAAGLFALIVVGALASNWKLFVDNIGTLGPVLVAVNIILLALGHTIAAGIGLERDQRVAIAIETGVQNGTLGITVGSLIMESANGLPPLSLPSGVYGITMYLVTAPYIVWARRGRSAATAE